MNDIAREISVDEILDILNQSTLILGDHRIFAGAGGVTSKKKGGHVPSEAPDNLFSESCICLTDLICEGPIEGLYVPPNAVGWTPSNQVFRSVYLNQTPIINDDNSANYFSYNVLLSTGTQDSAQGIVARTISIGQALKYSLQTSVVPGGPGLVAGYNHSILSPYVTTVIIGLRVSELTQVNTTSGDIGGYAVTFNVLIDGAVVYSGTISGKTTTGYVKSFTIPLPGVSPNEDGNINPRIVTIQKTNPDSTLSSITQNMILDYIVEVGTDSLIYPNSAIVRSKFSSRYFSQTPSREYDLLGLQVLVPSNYNPNPFGGLSYAQQNALIASNPQEYSPAYTNGNGSVGGHQGKYNGDWDGTFQTAQWSNNPAWCLYDLLTNTRYGLGNYINPSQIDIWALYQIAYYCDELVTTFNPDGTTGIEPRFTCNVKLDTRDDAFKIVMQFASLFRGLCFWYGGTFTFSQDSPKDPIMQFTNANITADGFSYTDIDKNSIYTVAVVGYYDQNDYFQKKLVYVQNPDGVRQYGIREVEVDAFGCTSRTQAYRLGKWALYSSLYEREIISFKTGLDILYCKPGDVIQVMDSDRLQDRRGGRLSHGRYFSRAKTLITLDQAIYLDPNIVGSMTVVVPANPLSDISSSAETEFPSQVFTADIDFVSSQIGSAGYYDTIVLDGFLPYSDLNGLIWSSYVWTLNTQAVDPAKIYYNNGNSNPFNSWALGFLNQQASYLQNIDIYGFTPVQYRILTIKEDGNGIYEITALQYNPDKYELIEDNNFVEPGIVAPPSVGGNVGNVGNISISQTQALNNTLSVVASWSTPMNFNSLSMSYNVSYTLNGVTTQTITKQNNFTIPNLTNPNTPVSISVYPVSDSNPSLAPAPGTVITTQTTAGSSGLSSLSITNLEIAGQGANTISISPDITINWQLSDPSLFTQVQYFTVSINYGSGFTSPITVSPTQTNGNGTYSYTLTYSANVAASSNNTASRNIIFQVAGTTIYNTPLANTATLSVTNPAAHTPVINNDFTVQNVNQGFEVNYNLTGQDSDFYGYILAYSTGTFTAANVSGVLSNNPTILPYPVYTSPFNNLLNLSDTISLPAGTPYFGMVIPFDTMSYSGSLTLNSSYPYNNPNYSVLFSGNTSYTVNTGIPSAPNGFNLVSVIETDVNGNNNVFIKMGWNPNPESNILEYDIQLNVTGYNTRYYSTPESQTNLYVPFSPGLSVTGLIRALNNQGNVGPYTTGFVNTPFISSASSAGGTSLPIGGTFIWPSTGSVPSVSGAVFLNCDGSYVYNSQYPFLFNALGYTEGQSSGISGLQFKIPSGQWNNTSRLLIRAA